MEERNKTRKEGGVKVVSRCKGFLKLLFFQTCQIDEVNRICGGERSKNILGKIQR
jgi:hypothetical protein